MLRQTTILVALLGFVSAAGAQNTDVIAARQAIYKGFGAATKPVAAMLKGDADFDLEAVKKSLAVYQDGAAKLPGLFPEDSKTGHDTEASGSIWANKSDFEGRFAKFGADAKADVTSITDKASFNAEMPKLLAQCGACHKQYRAK